MDTQLPVSTMPARAPRVAWWVIIGTVALFGIALTVWSAVRPSSRAPGQTPVSGALPSGDPVIVSTLFENRYLSIRVPEGWVLTEAGQGSAGAVNITNGNWVLFVNPAAGQASGVPGGRFDEYAGGAPGVELVMRDVPRPASGTECADIVPATAVAAIQGAAIDRFDFFAKASESPKDYTCSTPASGSAWFLSIFGLRPAFNDVASVTPGPVASADGFPVRQFAITFTYRATSAGALPVHGSAELEQMLAEAGAIVSTIAFR